MNNEYGKIPLHNGEPGITNEMKAECMGEFQLDIEQVCTACYYDEPQHDCEVCHGEIYYSQTHTIPWYMMKDIYKMMAKVAMKGKN